MIRLSIVIPSNRDNLTALARITEACSWAGPQIEVIIRDNSGSASKARFLANIRKENCHVIVTEPCGAQENGWNAVGRATGEFIFLLSDDDFCFGRAIAEVLDKIEASHGDVSVVGLTGAVMIDGSQGSSIVGYSKLDADDALARLSGYLSFGGPNVILFSPIRRDALNWAGSIVYSKPFKLSFDDQLCGLLYLLRGKFTRLNRLIYAYDLHNWETSESGQREDLKCYREAGLDPAINRLHWFLCAFEGATLIRNLELTPDYSLAQRQAMADYWFSMMFRMFTSNKRDDFGSPLSAEAEKLYRKWKMAAGQLTFEAMLVDICQFLAQISPEKAIKYFAFWSNILGLQQAPAA